MSATASSSPPVTQPRLSGFAAVRAFAADIKLSHSIFALPFALLAATLAARSPGAAWGVTWGVGTFVLIVICMVCARTVAMAANRVLDAELDQHNPRTARRALPSGQLHRPFVLGLIALFSLGFVAACGGFWLLYGNPWPLALSLPVLTFISAYPLFKRFTALCHYYLGACLALAPICAWIAVAANVAIEPLLMAANVLLWTAGFDVIYATADFESDRRTGVHSLPSRLGLAKALWVSRITHVLAIGCLVALGFASPDLGWLWLAATGVVAVLLIV